MNSDQIQFGGQQQQGLQQQNAGTTAHSFTIHSREERHLGKERAKESKRALRQEKVADKLSAKAEVQFNKAATKAQSSGMFAERSAMRHEEKAVKLAAAANFHRQAAAESQSEASRAEVLSNLPPRGTLPVHAHSSAPLGGSGGLSNSSGPYQSTGFRGGNQIV